MASRWIVKRGEKQAGPFTSPQLRSLAKSGQLRPTDLVTRQGSNRFVNAEEVRGLSFPEAMEADAEEMEFGTVEIIEDDEPVIVVEAVDEPPFVDYDYDADDDDEVIAEPVRPLSSRNREPAVRVGRSTRSRPSSRLEPWSRKRKSAKKRAAGDEDEQDAPWANLAYGVACLVGGLILFIVMSHEDPNTWETGRRGGLIIAILKLIYNIGGRWTVLGVLVLCSALFFWPAFNQFRKR